MNYEEKYKDLIWNLKHWGVMILLIGALFVWAYNNSYPYPSQSPYEDNYAQW